MAPDRAEFGAIWPSLARHRGDANGLRRIYERSQIPMVWLNNDRAYLHANAAARLFLRLTLHQIQALRADELVPHEHQRGLEDMWAELLGKGRVAGTIAIRLPDGAQFAVDYSGIANVLPGAHLFVFMPQHWPEEELSQFLGRERDGARGRLTARESEVLTVIARGAEIAEVARTLSLSPHTVRTHLRNALGKLGAQNRAHAIAIALGSGEITGPDPPGGA
jgi:DNA-binding CsgD family transcriptional regulator